MTLFSLFKARTDRVSHVRTTGLLAKSNRIWGGVDVPPEEWKPEGRRDGYIIVGQDGAVGKIGTQSKPN